MVALPLGPSPNFSCKIRDMGFLSQAGDFTSTSLISKSTTPSGLHIPSTEALQTKFSACMKLVDSLSAQNLLFFLLSCVEEFLSSCHNRMPLQFGPQCVCCLPDRRDVSFPGNGCARFSLSVRSDGPESFGQGHSCQREASYSFSSPHGP